MQEKIDDMQTKIPRQRETFYAGIAETPMPDADEVMERFHRGSAGKPHTAMIHLLRDLHRLRTHPAWRPLPGVLQVA